MVLLAAGVAGVAIVPELQALLIGMLVMLIAFLLGAAKLATDLIDLVRADLIADAVLRGDARDRPHAGHGRQPPARSSPSSRSRSRRRSSRSP